MSTKNIVIVFALLVLAAFIFGIAKDSKPVVNIPSIPETTSTTPTDFCYYRSDKTASGFYDKAWLRLHTVGTNVTGEFNNYPAEKDSKVGTFVGTIDTPTTASVIWDTKAEGMTAKEELAIKFSATDAQVAFGEMIQGANGVYVYKNKANITYQKSMPPIDCTNLDEIIAVEKYVRSADLKTLTKDNPVLGGSLFVTSVVVDPLTHTATISYEDGHNAFKGMLSYSYDLTTKKVSVNTFTKVK